MAQNKQKQRLAFVIEQDRCIGCEACMVACSVENNVPTGKHRNWVINTRIQGRFPELSQEYIPGNCLHCEEPPCVDACPTSASYQREDGLVLIDPELCIGCKYCMAACPYNARYYDEERQVVDKCSACVHRLDEGEVPACVETCIGGSRHFGDILDPESEVAQLLAQGNARAFHPETGTGPMFYYISSDPQSTNDLPVHEYTTQMTDVWRKMERPALIGMLGAAVAVTGAAYRIARRNAEEHFAGVVKEMEEEEAQSEQSGEEQVDG
jgi:tetrathionate reductase subunit B